MLGFGHKGRSSVNPNSSKEPLTQRLRPSSQQLTRQGPKQLPPLSTVAQHTAARPPMRMPDASHRKQAPYASPALCSSGAAMQVSKPALSGPRHVNHRACATWPHHCCAPGAVLGRPEVSHLRTGAHAKEARSNQVEPKKTNPHARWRMTKLRICSARQSRSSAQRSTKVVSCSMAERHHQQIDALMDALRTAS